MAGNEQRAGNDRGLSQRIAGAFDRVRGKDTSPEDQVWNQYMGKRRDWRELVVLVEDEQIRPEFQQRAIEALLAPDIRTLPFLVNVDGNSHTYAGLSNNWIEKITDAQAGFIAEKIPAYIKQASKAIRRGADNYGEREALFNYNGIIPGLLGKLPPEQAERLFESFLINDPMTYWNLDTASGYNPLQHLYNDRTRAKRRSTSPRRT